MKSKKLTLLIPEDMVRAAKIYAKDHDTSISALVTRLFEAFSFSEKTMHKQNSKQNRITASSLGMIKIKKTPKEDLISNALQDRFK